MRPEEAAAVGKAIDLVDMEFVGQPGHLPYEKGRTLASLQITQAVLGLRAPSAREEWMQSVFSEVRDLMNEALATGDASALIAVVIHLSHAAARLCEVLAANLNDPVDLRPGEPDSEVVDAVLQTMLALLESEALERQTGLGTS